MRRLLPIAFAIAACGSPPAGTRLATACRPRGIAVNSEALFWVTPCNGGELHILPKSTNADQTVVAPNAGWVAADENAVYWLSDQLTDARLNRLMMDSSQMEPLVANITAPAGLALDGADIYWSDRANGAVNASSKDGASPPRTVAAGVLTDGSVLRSQNLYWLSGPSTVDRLSTVSGTSEAVFVDSTSDASVYVVTATSHEAFIWTHRLSDRRPYVEYLTLYRDAQRLLQYTNEAPASGTDDEAFFWTHQSDLIRLELGDSAQETIATVAEPPSTQLVTDNEYVYWGSETGVYRAAKRN